MGTVNWVCLGLFFWGSLFLGRYTGKLGLFGIIKKGRRQWAAGRSSGGLPAAIVDFIILALALQASVWFFWCVKGIVNCDLFSLPLLFSSYFILRRVLYHKWLKCQVFPQVLQI